MAISFRQTKNGSCDALRCGKSKGRAARKDSHDTRPRVDCLSFGAVCCSHFVCREKGAAQTVALTGNRYMSTNYGKHVRHAQLMQKRDRIQVTVHWNIVTFAVNETICSLKYCACQCVKECIKYESSVQLALSK